MPALLGQNPHEREKKEKQKNFPQVYAEKPSEKPSEAPEADEVGEDAGASTLVERFDIEPFPDFSAK